MFKPLLYICTMKTCIYRITSPTNKVYIGQTRNVKDRFRRYKSLLCKNQTIIYNSLLKYGIDQHSFSIIQELDNNISQEELNKLECFFINYYKEHGFILMNIREGGSNGKHSEETKKKIGLSNQGKSRGKGFKWSDLQKKQHSERIQLSIKNGTWKSPSTGKPRSEETKRRISESNKGRIVSEENKIKLRNFNLGKKQSQDTIKKRFINIIGSTRTIEQRNNISKALSKNPIQVEHIITGEITICLNQKQCSQFIKCDRLTIWRILKGHIKKNSINNYKIKYYGNNI